MTNVHLERKLDVSTQDVWSRIGDFHSVDSWHPVVASQTASEDGRQRTLKTGDGAEIVESLIDRGDTSYSYRIDESPLPVANYSATISAAPSDGGSVVTWDAEFDAAGVSEDEAVAIVSGMLGAGLEAL